MFDDDNDSSKLPASAQPLTIKQLRDSAILAFDAMMTAGTGFRALDADELSEVSFLSVAETEAIVRDFGVIVSDEFMAIGGETREEAEAKIKAVLNALGQRIMSNVLAEGTRTGMLDSAFDDETDGFVFRLTDKGKEFRDRVAKEVAEYNEKPDDAASDDQ
jgi:hypothetical protein